MKLGNEKIKISEKIISDKKISVDISVEMNPTFKQGIEQDIDVTIQDLLNNKAKKIAREFEFILSEKEVLATLTKREIQILKLLASGKNNPEIAEILFISRRTVEQHRKNLNKKLNIKKPFQILRFATAFELFS
ncbi:MAG: helix-turn-helix transcriptional regulator [Balneola sp.]|nr:helix-turn-helix transcriptional regulator [Balneola sp.]MBO6651619.1 helix-turn-helix transcriptional regulator [Balneola sp.]MBO6710715.1 helix-turn-helix transcriptional regulator [Balneola sp.]MBO6869470.1 helix-turn-helix transcriptional regulator [Balneola sp.]